MGILEAAQLLTVKDAAIAYAEAGVSVIPLTGKKAGFWADAQKRPSSIGRIQYWDTAGQLNNVGIVCGAVSGNLVVIDCDGIGAVKMFTERFPELRQTFVVITGSRKGAHYYFYTALLPRTVRATGIDTGGALGNIELRADGHYVVAPPSIHPDTHKPYVIGRALPVKRLASLEYVGEWLNSIRPKMSTAAAPKPSGAGGHTSDPVTGMTDRDGKRINNPKGYARTALNGECEKVARTPSNGRNIQLNEAACKMGGFIGDGWIDRQVVEAALFGAAAACGLVKDDGARAALATIKSGIEAGMESSRVRYKNS